jgi:hypothetical protein
MIFQFQNGAKNFAARFRQGFGENFHHAAAIQTALAGIFFRQHELLNIAFALFHHLARFGPDIGFETTAAHRADDFAVGRHQHLAFFAHGQRAFRRDNRRHGGGTAFR